MAVELAKKDIKPEAVIIPSADDKGNQVAKSDSANQTLGAIAQSASLVPDKQDAPKLETIPAEKKVPEAAIVTDNKAKIEAKPEVARVTLSDKKPVVPVPEPKKLAEVKAEEPRVEVKKETNFIRDNIPPGLYVQVAAPRKTQEANEMAIQLKKAGFSVMIEAARVRGEEYFRIVVGPDSQRTGAEKTMGLIKKESSLKADPFVRAVKK